MVLTCEAEVQHWAAGRVIVRDEEGGLAAVKTTKAFRRADGQAPRPSKTVRWAISLDNEYGPTPISVRISIAGEKGEQALELPGDVALRARWLTYPSCGLRR